MGMTDKQYKSHLRRLKRFLLAVMAAERDEQKRLISEYLEDIQKDLED